MFFNSYEDLIQTLGAGRAASLFSSWAKLALLAILLGLAFLH